MDKGHSPKAGLNKVQLPPHHGAPYRANSPTNLDALIVDYESFNEMSSKDSPAINLTIWKVLLLLSICKFQA
jgi:hypothetical protein